MKAYMQVTSGETVTRYWLVGKDDMDIRAWSDALFEHRNPQRKQQVTTGNDWTKIKVVDRKNDAITIDLGTRHEFATELECWDFKNSFSRADEHKPHPLIGDVYFRLELEGGGWVDERLVNAGINVTAIESEGKVTARISYRITGGQLESGFEGSSGTYSWLEDEDGYPIEDEDGFFMADETHES